MLRSVRILSVIALLALSVSADCAVTRTRSHDIITTSLVAPTGR